MAVTLHQNYPGFGIASVRTRQGGFVADEFEVVDVWVGQFPSEEAADDYFEETYADPEDGEEQPISQFAADMGESFYDHDFVEREFHPQGISDLSKALAGHSFSSSYSENVIEAASRADVPEPIDTVLLVWGGEIEAPVSVRTPAMSLVYIGRFDCDPNAPATASG
jgi:hypothetical protein